MYPVSGKLQRATHLWDGSQGRRYSVRGAVVRVVGSMCGVWAETEAERHSQAKDNALCVCICVRAHVVGVCANPVESRGAPPPPQDPSPLRGTQITFCTPTRRLRKILGIWAMLPQSCSAFERSSQEGAQVLGCARYWMLGAGALGRPRGTEWGGRREEGSGWGTRPDFPDAAREAP